VLILINVFFAISEGSLTLQYLLYIIVSILLNIFLICIAGIFIGSFSALKMKKIPAYLLMIFITIMTSRILDILWLALYTTTNIDFVTKAKQFIATYDEDTKTLIVIVDEEHMKK
jgi:uncharacterized membrane protein YkvI